MRLTVAKQPPIQIRPSVPFKALVSRLKDLGGGGFPSEGPRVHHSNVTLPR